MTVDDPSSTSANDPTISRDEAQRELRGLGIVYRTDDGRILTYDEAFDELTSTMEEGLEGLPPEEQTIDGTDFEEFVWENGIYRA